MTSQKKIEPACSSRAGISSTGGSHRRAMDVLLKDGRVAEIAAPNKIKGEWMRKPRNSMPAD